MGFGVNSNQQIFAKKMIQNLWKFLPSRYNCQYFLNISRFLFSKSMLHGTEQERTKYKQQLQLVGNEKQAVEKARQGLLHDIDERQKQIEKLKATVAELNRQKDDVEDEKVWKENMMMSLLTY